MKQKISIKNKSKKRIDKFDTVYNAIFRIDGLRKRLSRPPIEINNNRYIQMWRGCFFQDGRFRPSPFNQYLPLLSEWKSAFYLMWIDLKSVTVKSDRTAMINCFARFVKGSPYVDQYIDFILKDFFYYPLHLHYSDFNALIFTNMLLFKNYAHQDYDFERTPEEMLLSKDEKNTELIDRLCNLIANPWGDRFYQKIQTIKKNLQLALKPQKAQVAALSADILISILREVLIFFTLVGGAALRKVVRDTVEEFGDPESELYQSKNSAVYLKQLLQLLQVGIRCLIIFGDKTDIELLRVIRSREKDFLALKGILNLDLSFHQKVVKKIISIIEEGTATVQSPPALAL